MGLISPKNFEPGQLELYPYLSDDMTLPLNIKYAVHTKILLNDNARYHRKGVTHLQESAYGVANSGNRLLIHKIPGSGILKNNGVTTGIGSSLTRTQMRSSADQANVTHMTMHQMQEGDPYIASASSQSFWFSERVLEKQAEFFPSSDPIYGGNYGDFSMGQMDYLDSSNAVAQNSRLANATAAKAGLTFWQNTFTAMDSSTKTLADVHTAYNCRLYPTTPLGNEMWVHRMLFMMILYVVAGWNKWHMLFFWPAFESAGASVAHSGWAYTFKTTNPGGELDSFGHIHIDPQQALAIGFLWAQGVSGATKRCFYVWSNSSGYTTDINKHGAVHPGSKPADRWRPNPGSPSTFPYVGEGQLNYPSEPLWGFDGIDQGIRMWERSYREMGSVEGTKAFCEFSLNGGSTWQAVNPGGVHSILHGLANKYGIAETEDTTGKRKWVWYDPFATPGVARTVLLKHASGAIHTAQTIGNKLYCNVTDV